MTVPPLQADSKLREEEKRALRYLETRRDCNSVQAVSGRSNRRVAMATVEGGQTFTQRPRRVNRGQHPAVLEFFLFQHSRLATAMFLNLLLKRNLLLIYMCVFGETKMSIRDNKPEGWFRVRINPNRESLDQLHAAAQVSVWSV